MSARVFFVEPSENSRLDERVHAAEMILDGCGLEEIVARRNRTTVKIHLLTNAERHPRCARNRARGSAAGEVGRGQPLLDRDLRPLQGIPLQAVEHLEHIFAHGFTYPAVDAAFIMVDGLSDNSEVEVRIPGMGLSSRSGKLRHRGERGKGLYPDRTLHRLRLVPGRVPLRRGEVKLGDSVGGAAAKRGGARARGDPR